MDKRLSQNFHAQSMESSCFGEGRFSLSRENHSMERNCSNVDCSNYNRQVFLQEVKEPKHVRAVREAPFLSRNAEKLALVCQCPDCEAVSWFHIDTMSILLIRRRLVQQEKN